MIMTDAERARAKATMREHGIGKMVTHGRGCAMVSKPCTCSRPPLVLSGVSFGTHAPDCAKLLPGECSCTPDVILADDA